MARDLCVQDWDGLHESLDIPLKLPNIHQLASVGTRFTHAYVQAPVCAPSRSCLASGREYDRAGVPTNFANDYNISIPTFYGQLRDAGYHTMTCGKDDLDKATQLGTKTGQGNWTGLFHQAALGFSDGLRCSGKGDVIDLKDKEPHEMYGHWLASQNVSLANGTTMSAWRAHYICMAESWLDGTPSHCTSDMFPDKFYEDNWVATTALTLLRRKPKGKPWFMQVNFPGPHPPFLVTANQTEAVRGRTFPKAADNSKSKRETCADPTGEPECAKVDRCDYASEMENLDRLFGLVVAEVKRQEGGSLNNTVICFASDHGEMLGDHGDSGKTMPWQGSASVPLMCTGPGIRKGAVVDVPIATIDVGATFIDYAGATLAPGMTTTSLRPLLEQGQDAAGGAYRAYVSSGLQSYPFNSDLSDNSDQTTTTNDQTGGVGGGGKWAWRMVVERDTGLKFICCKGRCPGVPASAPPVDRATGYQEILLNTTADPFDMHPLNEKLPDAVTRLRPLLPASFRCAEQGGLSQAELRAVLAADDAAAALARIEGMRPVCAEDWGFGRQTCEAEVGPLH